MELISTKSGNREGFRIFEKGYNYSCGYYSECCWAGDDRLVLSRNKNMPEADSNGKTDLVLIDLKNKSEKVLYQEEGDFLNYNHLVYGNVLYYVENKKTLCSINVDTLQRKEIYKSTGYIVAPHITADGRYINWSDEDYDPEREIWTCLRIDIKTGEIVKMFEKGFMPPYKTANHMMICPTNPDLIFFSHEGVTTYVGNRLWLAPFGKEPYCIAKQRFDENSNLIDCFGHESWASDGKGVYFVKYDVSPSKPTGIGYVDLKSKEPKLLFTKHKYWHVCAAPNGKYLAADLGPNDLDENDMADSGVCLIDMGNNTEEIISNAKHARSHPGHPHPQFNPSCTKICFNNAIDKDTLAVDVINI